MLTDEDWCNKYFAPRYIIFTSLFQQSCPKKMFFHLHQKDLPPVQSLELIIPTLIDIFTWPFDDGKMLC